MLKLIIKRFLLIIIGIILSLVFLECGLRLAGWTISYYQQYKNNKALRSKSQYTIMCLGESTTQRQYPVQLKKILNKKYPNKFSVIDCGLRASNLETIFGFLDDNIKKYKPDIAICMMGVNNSRNFTNNTNNFNDYYIVKSKKITFKIIKLFMLIKQHIKNLKTDEAFAQELESNSNLLDKAIRLQHENKFKESVIILNKILKIEKKNTDLYQKAYTYIILNYWAFSDNKKEQEIAAKMALHAILNNFYDKNAYYFYLFSHLISTNQTEQFETVKSLLLNEKEFVPNADIYNLIRKHLTDSEKQKLLDKILAVEKNNCHVIAMQYLKEKNYQKAKEYFIKAEEERLLFPNINMYTLYKLIVKKLIDNNIKVICMQYPVRSILPLQEQLKTESYYDKITFISNEKIFKDTLMVKDYDELFPDQFAGDFGHCTNLGNTMIAENVVNSLEEILDLKQN